MKPVAENTAPSVTSFVVEIDGEIRSKYGLFFDALKAGMELKRKFPHSDIKVHDANPRS